MEDVAAYEASTDTNNDGLKAAILCRLIEQGERYRDERFGKTAKQLEQYDYTEKLLDDITWDQEITFNIKVRKTSQFKREIGSRLFNANPTFRAASQPWSKQKSRERADIIEAYLNYCTQENGFFDSLEDCLINGGLGCGRGVMWTGLHPDKDGVVTCTEDSWDNLIIDPDAKKWEQVNWVARKRFKPRWWLMKKYPEHKKQLASVSGSTRRTDDAEDESEDTSTEMICFYEVWTRVSLSNYRDGGSMSMPDEPVKYIVTKSQKLLLWEGDWETPLHLDGRWPCVTLDFYKHPKEIWPISPLEPGIPWLRAINVIATMLMAKYRVCNGRTIIAMIKANGTKISEEDEDKILYGNNPVDVIFPIVGSVDNNPDIRNVVQTITLESDLNSDMAVFNFAAEQFEKETGLYEFLFTGQGPRQDRSAMATEVRDRNTRSRIDFMKTKLDQFLSTLGRQLALTARFHFDGEDIAPFLGPEAAQYWGVLMSPEDMDPNKLIDEFMAEGVPYEDAAMQAELILEDATSYDEWRNEIDYGIEVGSTVRRSPEAEREANDLAIQQVVPVMLQTGLYEAAGVFLAKLGEFTGLDPAQTDLIRQSLSQLQRQAEQQAQQQAQAEDARLQMQAKTEDARLQMQMQAEQAKMQMEAQRAQMKLNSEAKRDEQKLSIERERMEMERERMIMDKESVAKANSREQSPSDQRVTIEESAARLMGEAIGSNIRLPEINVDIKQPEVNVAAPNVIVHQPSRGKVVAKPQPNGDVLMVPEDE